MAPRNHHCKQEGDEYINYFFVTKKGRTLTVLRCRTDELFARDKLFD